jgi:sporulation protein YlmC with PRC-barrel domain
MLKKLGLSACVLLLGTGLAVAGSPGKQPATESGRSAATAPSSLSTSSWLASDIYKSAVYDNNEKKIGDVNDLVIDSAGIVKSAVIGVGGFLGAGEKEVAVPFSDLKIASREGKSWVVLDRTKQELEKAPAYDKKMKSKMD